MWQAVGFDLDNTLYDQGQHLRSFFHAASRRLSVEAHTDPGQVEECFLATWQRRTMAYPFLFDDVLHALGVWRRDRVLDLILQYRAHRCPLLCYPGVPSLLENLARQYALFLITDGHRALQEFKVDQLCLRRFFRVAVFTDDLGPNGQKPAPQAFLDAASRLGLPPASCLFVGDDPDRDITGAYLAGMCAVRVRTGPYWRNSCLVGPDFTISDVPALAGILRDRCTEHSDPESAGGMYGADPSPARHWELKIRRGVGHHS